MLLSYRLLTPPTVEPVTVALAKQQCRIDFDADDTLIQTYIVAARQYAEKYTNRAFHTQQWQLSLDHFPLPRFQTTLTAEQRHEWPFFGSAWDYFAIRLPKPTCISVDSVTYLDLTATEQTLDPSTYFVDTSSEPARLVPAQNLFWPYTQQYLPGSVKINFTAGTYVQSTTDTFTVPASAPYTIQLYQADKIITLGSVTDASGNAVASTCSSGILTFDASLAGQELTASYTYSTCPQTIILAILLLVGHWYEHRQEVSELNLKNIPLGVNALLDTEVFTTLTYEAS